MFINQKIKYLIQSNKDYLISREFKGENDPDSVIFDGIVDESQFNGVLYLLKEATSAGLIRDFIKSPQNYVANEFIDGDWDFITTTSRVAKEQNDTPLNWKPLCFWTEAFVNPNKYFNDAINCEKNLNSIAIINIKKTPGESTSDDKLLNKISSDNIYKNILLEEINLISPNIIICGGTFEYAKNICNISSSKILELKCGVKYFIYNNAIYLDFIHPSQYGAAAKLNLTYAFAQIVFKEIKEIFHL